MNIHKVIGSFHPMAYPFCASLRALVGSPLLLQKLSMTRMNDSTQVPSMFDWSGSDVKVLAHRTALAKEELAILA